MLFVIWSSIKLVAPHRRPNRALPRLHSSATGRCHVCTRLQQAAATSALVCNRPLPRLHSSATSCCPRAHFNQRPPHKGRGGRGGQPMQCTFTGGGGGVWGVEVRAGGTGAGQRHLRNAAWCTRENNAKRSFRRAGAAQEGSHVGSVFFDGHFEGSAAVTAGQRVRFGSTTARARAAGTFAAPGPRGDVRFGVDQEFCNFCMTSISRHV